MDVEAVRECECVARLQMGFDMLLVDLGLQFVGNEHHDEVRFLGGLVHRGHLEARFFGLGPRRRPFAQADAYVDA